MNKFVFDIINSKRQNDESSIEGSHFALFLLIDHFWCHLFVLFCSRLCHSFVCFDFVFSFSIFHFVNVSIMEFVKTFVIQHCNYPMTNTLFIEKISSETMRWKSECERMKMNENRGHQWKRSFANFIDNLFIFVWFLGKSIEWIRPTTKLFCFFASSIGQQTKQYAKLAY